MGEVAGPRVLRVEWLPGSDLLQGTCHCGAVHIADSPIAVWSWLTGHPVGHDLGASAAPSRPPVSAGASA